MMLVSKKKYEAVCQAYDDTYDDLLVEGSRVFKLKELVKKIYDSGHLKSRALMKEIEEVLKDDEG